MKPRKKSISRRTVIKGMAATAGLAAAGVAGASVSRINTKTKSGKVLPNASEAPKVMKYGRGERKVIVLGMDGMDPDLVRRFASEGAMPTFSKALQEMHFGNLKTTMPPQSPVAWSSFITGTEPGGHGIFDFIHRDPKLFLPYLSTSRSFDAKRNLKLGSWSLPLGSGEVKLMRQGKALWQILEENGIPAKVIQIPANFPVVAGSTPSISGMGTPDLLGSYGTFTFLTEVDVPGVEKVDGGKVQKVRAIQNRIIGKIGGPVNSFRVAKEQSEAEIIIDRDPTNPLVRISLQDNELVMREGEWSGWLPVKFDLVPHIVSVPGMVRLYLKKVHPHLQLYISPVNIDPADATLPISSPPSYSEELTKAIGRFYTQGFPADTKALSSGVFSNEEFVEQAKLVLEESMAMLDYELSRFKDGMFFFYFSTIDQTTHMMWRMMDPKHPQYNPAASELAKGAVRYFYSRMDDALKMARAKIDPSTLLLTISDHGFAPFYREFHLSTWLVQAGYTVFKDRAKFGEGEFFEQVDWSRTRAYALGINGLYLNRVGREPRGIVTAEQAPVLKAEIMSRLAGVTDPLNSAPMLTQLFDGETLYHGPFCQLAPDIVVGYRRGYRSSDEAVFGKFPKELVGYRTNAWAADHCMDPAVVPGILLTNQKVTSENPAIWDLAPTILKSFSVEAPPQMTGKVVLDV